MLLYAYGVGTVSSWKIKPACREDLAFRVLTAKAQQVASRFTAFRRQNLEGLSELIAQILWLCQKPLASAMGWGQQLNRCDKTHAFEDIPSTPALRHNPH